MQKNNRQKIRFTPEDLDVAFLDFDMEGAFNPQIAVLPINESGGGCMIAVRKQHEIEFADGMNLVVKVGRLQPLKSVVRWKKNIDENLFVVGLEYQE